MRLRREDSKVKGHLGREVAVQRDQDRETEMVALRLVMRVPQSEKVKPNDR